MDSLRLSYARIWCMEKYIRWRILFIVRQEVT